ncbi:uncharacterized protein F5891DRAFT_898799, partial [Suillus fuscotomentosus]
MAKIARDYHDNLQRDNLASRQDVANATEEVLDKINRHLSDEDKLIMQATLTEENIDEVLKLLPNSKAMGIDGLPYEFWKWLKEVSDPTNQSDDTESENFNLTKCITQVYNDIETFGVAEETHFSE